MVKKNVLFTLLISASLFAAEEGAKEVGFDHTKYYVPDNVGYPFSACYCCPGPQFGTFSIRHKEADGIGYHRGYSSIDLFLTPNLCNETYAIIDLRAHIFNNAKWATNVGIGLRRMAEVCEFVYGANFYWDWRDSEHARFNQLGGGLEFLWPYWDIRINGYGPVGQTKRKFDKGFDGFRDHAAYAFQKYKLAMWGADVDVGYWWWRGNCFGFRTALSGYYFEGKYDTHAVGGMLRAKMTFWDYFSLEGQFSYDTRFHWKNQGEIALTLPFGDPVTRFPRCTSCCPSLIALEKQLVDRPERFEIIVATTKKRTCQVRHPVTDDRLRFFFVNNTAPDGDGSFEHPFHTLKQAQFASAPGDAIYVFTGDGTSKGMDQGIVLKNNQILLGSSVPFDVNSCFGKTTLPALTDKLPIISNPDHVVTVANGDIISGLNLIAEFENILQTSSIFGRAVHDLTVENSVLTNKVNNHEKHIGIDISGPFSGNFVIKNNRILPTNVVGATGVLFEGPFFGNFLAETNFIRSKVFELNAPGIGVGFLKSANGQFTFTDNTIVAKNGLGGEGIHFEKLTGIFKAQNNDLSIVGEGGAFIGAGINVGKFDGSFSLENNKISLAVPRLVVSSLGVNFRGPFIGSFNAQNNVISVASGGPTTGINFQSNFKGEFVAEGNTISCAAINPLGASAQGIEFIGQFKGDFTAKNNTISVAVVNGLGDIQTVAGIEFSSGKTAIGQFLITDNTISVAAASGSLSVNGISFFNGIIGDLSLKTNTISVAGKGGVVATGIQILNGQFHGTFVAEYNQVFTTGSAVFINDFNNSYIFMRNNFLDGLVNIAPINANVDIQNDFIKSLLFVNEGGLTHVRFDKNEFNDANFNNIAGTLEIESPNLKLSGLKGINQGKIEVQNVTFVPFE